VNAHPARWMVNPYTTDGTAVTLEGDLERLYATRSGVGYLAHGADALPRIDGTRYFYRDGTELEVERETFEDLQQSAR
jgi:hypothetical protein